MATQKSTRSRLCIVCGSQFSYEVSRGKDRLLCGSKECGSKRLIQGRERRFNADPKYAAKCSTYGCKNRETRIKAKRCEACYVRFRRNGTTTLKGVIGFTVNSAGYRSLATGSHPLSVNGRVYEHRAVFYDSVLGVSQPCFWCGVDLSWDEMSVDHLNENKGDNRIENLVASCNPCNRMRGAMLPFIRRMCSESFPKFVELLSDVRRVS